MSSQFNVLALLLVSSLSARTCLPAYKTEISYQGCYHNPNSPRDLADPLLTVGKLNSPQYCANLCGAAGYAYSGVEFAIQCFCGHEIESTSVKAGESQCNADCPADRPRQEVQRRKDASSYLGLLPFSSTNTSKDQNIPHLQSLREPAPGPVLSRLQPRSALQQRRLRHQQAHRRPRRRPRPGAHTRRKASNLASSAAGSARLGLPAYQWQNEALHGVAGTTGVQFASPFGSAFSAATNFPMPILLAAAFDDALVRDVAATISTEARAFANHGRAGLDFWTPNINPFCDPRRGRGMETLGEDARRGAGYVLALVNGLQGGVNPAVHRTAATCKHFAAYDFETGRTQDDVRPAWRDMADYYLPPFESCVRDAKAGSVMCAYNSVDGLLACASRYLLQNLLRDGWGFTKSYNYVVSDCDAVDNIFEPHHYAKDRVEASALGINAGTDLDCGDTHTNLNQGVRTNLTNEAALDRSLARLYAALIKVGYFDPPGEYGKLSWRTKPRSKARCHRPVGQRDGQDAGQLRGHRAGACQPAGCLSGALAKRNARGADNDSDSTSNFGDALDAARSSDYVVYLGGIETDVENEGHDRTSIAWPGNQLDLISQLAELGKALVVVKFGDGQIDDSSLLDNGNVNSILWAGYPGQDGGNAVFDVLTGAAPPAGQLPITQYPASYVDGNDILDMSLLPANGILGRTYMRYTGTPLLPFGRASSIQVGSTQKLNLGVSIADLARSDEDGDRCIYPGDYTVALDTTRVITAKFKLTGWAAKFSSLPRKA